MFATFSSLTNTSIAPGAAEDSKNILPILLGESLENPIRVEMVHHSARGMFALRLKSWKLIFGLGSGGRTFPKFDIKLPWKSKGQLYNLADDVEETEDLFNTQNEIVQSLEDTFKKYREDDVYMYRHLFSPNKRIKKIK